MKRIVLILACVATVLAGLVLCLWLSTRPPKETALLQNFREHRVSFELLREMLQADTNLNRLATWGVDTERKGISKPPDGNFSLERFNKYLALMKEVGAGMVGRSDDNASIGLWASGFGGDIVHIKISWEKQAPTRQVASLQQYYRDHKAPPGNDWIYQHIEGNWYLCTDLWSTSRK